MYILQSLKYRTQWSPTGDVFIWNIHRPTKPMMAIWKGAPFQFETANDNEG